MLVELLKNAFKPNDEARSHNILQKGTVAEVTDAQGKELIERGLAAEWKPSKKADAPADGQKPSKAKKADASAA